MARKKNIVASKRYIFIDKVPYKIVKRLPADDLLVVINLREHRRVAFVLSATRHKIEKAWTTFNVASLLGRSTANIRGIVSNEHVSVTGVVYQEEFPTLVQSYIWHRDDILNLHEHLRTTRGTAIPTKDGLWKKAQKLPSRTELVSMMDSGVVSYVRTKDGEFIPAFLDPNN